MYRVAAVFFLNTLPLVDWLIHQATAEVQVDFALPSQLAAQIQADQADVALLPTVEYFRGSVGELIPGIGIATCGPVGSVKLFCRVPPARLERVTVDQAARTSVALLRILLAELYGVKPDLCVAQPDPGDPLRDTEAALIIGDRCFAAEAALSRQGAAAVQAYDLGELWTRHTGVPFVFAGWVLGQAFRKRATQVERTHLIDLLTQARDHGLDQLDSLAAREAAAGRLGPGGEATVAALSYYFRDCLRFVLGAKEMAGLHRFGQLCVEHAICPPGRTLRLAAAGQGD
jgi:chorismate dehydratase